MFITPPDYPSFVSHQMEILDHFLLDMKDILVRPIVAGGAPRSWFFHERAKDIDIFLPPTDIPELLIKLQSVYPQKSFDVKLTQDLLPEYQAPYLNGVISFTINRVKFQLIIQSEDVHPFSFFPINICLISYENYCITYGVEFLYAIRHHTLKIKSNTPPKYFMKIMSYFPTFRVLFFEERAPVLRNTLFD